MRGAIWGLALAASLPAAHAADWSGAYGGLNFGGGDGAADVDNPYRGVFYTESTNAKGPLWGAQAGYSFQDDNLVYGAEVLADVAGLTGTATCLSGIHLGRCRPQVNALGSLTGRLGWADGANLFYAKAGLAWMNDREQYLLFNLTPASAQAREDRFGWVVGAGLEHRIAAQWSLRLDYQYLGFDSTTFHLAVPGDLDFAAHQHMLTMGVNYYLDTRDDDDTPAILSVPDDEPGDWAFEVTGRFFGAVGNVKKDFDDNPGNENSRLNWQGMPMTAGEIFARADHKSGWFAEGSYGAGVISGGGLYDEDTPYADFGNGNYSNTISYVRKGSFSYQSASFGFNVIDRDDLQLGVLAGYSHMRFKGPGFGCDQLANNNSVCKPDGYFSHSYEIITETDDWHAARLGVDARVALLQGLSLSGEIAYLPYAFIRGIDHHNARDIVFAGHGVGDGVQMESSLDYALTDSISLGVGGRYWEWHAGGATVSCQGLCSDTFPAQRYTFSPWGGPYDMHLFGGFAQASYHFGRIAHDETAATDDFTFGWEGSYVGVQGGARAGQAQWHTDCIGTPCNTNRGSPNTMSMPSGAGYLGLLAGYLQQIAPDWLLGVEGDAGWANNSRTEQNIWLWFLPNTRARPDDPATVKQDWDAGLRLRGGYLVTPNTLAYVTAGMALEGVRVRAACNTAPGYWCLAPRDETATGTQFGFILGAGAETALSEQLSARLEYRYTDAGTFRHQFFGSAPADEVTMAAAICDQRLLLGLVWRP